MIIHNHLNVVLEITLRKTRKNKEKLGFNIQCDTRSENTVIINIIKEMSSKLHTIEDSVRKYCNSVSILM